MKQVIESQNCGKTPLMDKTYPFGAWIQPDFFVWRRMSSIIHYSANLKLRATIIFLKNKTSKQKSTVSKP
jgi:hypothetical protein